MKIAVASNHIGFKAKESVVSLLRSRGHDVTDFGPPNDEICDYPDFATKVALAVSSAKCERGILIGGTGIGMSIVANKFRGIRAALCHDTLSAEMSRRHNDANILCLSVALSGEEIAVQMVDVWLATPFEGGQHHRRLTKIIDLENDLWHR